MGFFRQMGRPECCAECTPAVCDPCAGPCLATMECQSRSASGSKDGPPACAYASFNDDGRFWLTSTLSNSRTASGNFNCHVAANEEEGIPASSQSWDYNSSDTWTTRTTCNPETNAATCEVLASYFHASTHQSYSFGDGDPETSEGSKSGTMGDCTAIDYWMTAETTGDFGIPYLDDPEIPRWYFENDGWPLSPGGAPPWEVIDATSRSAEFSGSGANTYSDCTAGGSASCTWSKVLTEVLTDEWTPETTAELIARVTGMLGSWTDGGCAGGRHLSDDESGYSIAEERVRLRHLRPSSGYLKATIIVETTPDGGEPEITTIDYVWDGEPDGGEIVGDWITIPTPSENSFFEVSVGDVICTRPTP